MAESNDLTTQGYAQWLGDLKSRVQQVQTRAAVSVNRELLQCYWDLGHEIIEKQASSSYGDQLLQRLSHDLSAAFPAIKGFSTSNLQYIRRWVAFYSLKKVEQAVPHLEPNDGTSCSTFVKAPSEMLEIPWGHNLKIISKCATIKEALYPALQFSEIALRNAVHRELSLRCGTDAWYDSPKARLTPWQQDKVTEAKNSLSRLHKPLSPGRIIAELNFGFWTGFFNKPHARTGIGSFLSKKAFQHAPSTEQVQAKLAQRWQSIRELRNRVFHHERILHWRNLDQQHQAILEITEWISPELQEFTRTLDRFASIRKDGLGPWNDHIQNNWPPKS